MGCSILSIGLFGSHTENLRMYMMFGIFFFIFSKCFGVTEFFM